MAATSTHARTLKIPAPPRPWPPRQFGKLWLRTFRGDRRYIDSLAAKGLRAPPQPRAPPPPAGRQGARRRFISEEDYEALAARGLLPPTLAPPGGGMWRDADPGAALEALGRQGEAELQALYAVPPAPAPASASASAPVPVRGTRDA